MLGRSGRQRRPLELDGRPVVRVVAATSRQCPSGEDGDPLQDLLLLVLEDVVPVVADDEEADGVLEAERDQSQAPCVAGDRSGQGVMAPAVW